MMSEPRIECFEDFWPYYVGAHRARVNRALHYAGTSCALGCVGAFVITGQPLLLLAAPVVGYGPAWVGHFLVEGNKPATLAYPLYSLRADFKMLGLALRGKMADEVKRLYASVHSEIDAPSHDPVRTGCAR